MSEVRIVARHPDGTEHDVTEAVQITYDALRHSLDWGSGFLDSLEVAAVVDLAEHAGFEDFEQLVVDVWIQKQDSQTRWQRRLDRGLAPHEEFRPQDITPAERAAILHELKGDL